MQSILDEAAPGADASPELGAALEAALETAMQSLTVCQSQQSSLLQREVMRLKAECAPPPTTTTTARVRLVRRRRLGPFVRPARQLPRPRARGSTTARGTTTARGSRRPPPADVLPARSPAVRQRLAELEADFVARAEALSGELTSSVAERKGQCEEHVAEHAAALTESLRALRQAPNAAWQARASHASGAARKPALESHVAQHTARLSESIRQMQQPREVARYEAGSDEDESPAPRMPRGLNRLYHPRE